MRWIVALAIVVLLGAVALLSMGRHSSLTPDPVPAEQGLPSVSVATAGPAVTDEAVTEPLPGVSHSPERSSSPPASAGPELAEIRGRFLLADGSPATGMELYLNGWSASPERASKSSPAEDWEAPEEHPDEDGSFSFRFDPPASYQFQLYALLPRHPSRSWRWEEIAPGSVIDLGEVTFPRGGAIRGRVVNAAGVPQRGFQVIATARSGSLSDRRRADVTADEVTGEFLLEGMPAGPALLEARSRLTGWIDGPVVNVVAGDVVEADIVYDGPDILRRITVVTFTGPFHTDDLSDAIHLYGPDGMHRTATHVEGSSQSESFEDLPAGSYTVEIKDPRFRVWRRDGVAPGTSLNAHLKGSCQLSLEVTDAKGAPISRYGVRGVWLSLDGSPDEFELPFRGEEPPENCVYSGLVPGDYLLAVSAEGYGDARVEVSGLQPGEQRAVRVEMRRGLTVTGSVVAGGPSVNGAMVTIFEPGQRHPLAPPPALWGGVADPEGGFSIENVSSGEWMIEARLNALVVSKPVRLSVRPGEDVSGVRIELPAFGRFRGAFPSWPPEARGFSVEFQPADGERDGIFFFVRRDDCTATVEATGAFRAAPLTFGTYMVRLVMPRTGVQKNTSSLRTVPGACRELGTFTLDRPVLDLGSISGIGLGALEAKVFVDKQAVPRCQVHLVKQERNAGSREPQEGTCVMTDEEGVARIPALFAGHWTVSVTQMDAMGEARHPGLVHVSAGDRTEVTVNVTRSEHPVVFLDRETGQPVKARDLIIFSEASGVSWPVNTDPEGQATLNLPVGSCMAQAGRREARFEWAGSPQLQVVYLEEWD